MNLVALIASLLALASAPGPASYWIAGPDANCAIGSDGERYGEICPAFVIDTKTGRIWLCGHDSPEPPWSAGGACVACGHPVHCVPVAQGPQQAPASAVQNAGSVTV